MPGNGRARGNRTAGVGVGTNADEWNGDAGMKERRSIGGPDGVVEDEKITCNRVQI